ncbi:MAG: FMN-binding negative transcriptional regulator [Balneolaceae bacterium]
MYTPSSFKEENPDVLFAFIEENSFGVLFSQHLVRPEATHLPFLFDKKKGNKGILIAHFAKANKHWKTLDETKEVLCVFQGPHTYISPSWYKNRETVPTWNYATVHVYGRPRVIHDLEELSKMVTSLTHHHEEKVDSDWSLEEAKAEFETDLKAIVGLEIEITRMEGKFKFNQNRSKEDQLGVIEHLNNNNASGVKEIMKRNLED